MNTTVDDPESLGVDPEGEIKKLQELVKKLELQNQLLLRQNSQDEKVERSRQLMPEQIFESGNSGFAQIGHQQMTGKLEQSSQVLRQLNGVKTALANSTNCMTPEKHSIDKSERTKVEISKLSLESIGLVDIDRLSLDVEDSWLYKSPRQTPGTETTKSPFLWLREEFDQPSDDQISSFHRSLYYKLDEVTRHGDPGSQWQQKMPDIKSSGNTEAEHNLDFIPDKGDVTDIIGVAPIGKLVESRPLASQEEAPCVKKNTADSDISEKGAETLIRLSTLIGKDRRVSESSIADTGYQNVSSASEENLLGVKYRLAHVTDVKVLAKMQEESLRMSFNSPLASKKALSKSLNRSSGRLVDSCDSLLSDSGYSKGLNQSTGALIETVDYAADSKTKRSIPQKRMNESRTVSKSATSLAVPASRAAARSGLPKAQVASNSLPGTPYGSNQEISKPTLSTTSNAVPYRQSLPNLNRNLKFSVLKSHPSDSRLAATGKKPLSLLRQSSPSSASTGTLGHGTRPMASTGTLGHGTRPMASTGTLGHGTRHMASMGTLGRGTRPMAPVKATASAMQRPGARSTNAVNNSAVAPVSLSSKNNRPTTLASTDLKTTRAMTSGSGRTTPGATTPTSKAKPLVVNSKKTNVTTPTRTTSIPKPGSLTKLSIPQKTNVQASQSTSAPTNDDDDWKEGCF